MYIRYWLQIPISIKVVQTGPLNKANDLPNIIHLFKVRRFQPKLSAPHGYYTLKVTEEQG